MIHEDGDNDAIGGNDDESAISWNNKEEDEEHIRFLGGNSSSEIKKYRGSNSNDGGNTKDGVKIADNVVEEEDGEWICFLGGNNSSGTKKYRGSNSSDGGNTGDGVKIAGEVIGSGDEIKCLYVLQIRIIVESGTGTLMAEKENVVIVKVLGTLVLYNHGVIHSNIEELLPESIGDTTKEILGDITQKDIGRYYPKRYWEILPKEILRDITQRDTFMYLGNNISG
ncbi:hypothetical protein Tco_0223740 [Tanacetum coccineum]